MKQERLLRFAVDAGELTMASGAEAYRAEDTIVRILNTRYENSSASFVVGTGLIASVHTEDGYDFTAVRRIRKRDIDLDKLSDINSISRGFISGRLTLSEAEEQIERVRTKTEKKTFSTLVGVSLTSITFAFLLDGTFMDAALSGVIGLIIGLFMLWLQRRSSGVFVQNVAIGIIIAVLSALFSRLGLIDNLAPVIISGLMPVLPGATFTSALRDIVDEDYLTGTSRLMESIIIAISLVAGVSTGLNILSPAKIAPVLPPLLFSNPVFEIFIAALATYFCSILFKTPKNEKLICAITGGVSWGVYLIFEHSGHSTSMCVFAGTMVVSFLSRLFAYTRQRPQTVFFIPGLIPYFPGADLYNTMEAIKNSNFNGAFVKGLETIKIAGAISITVAIIALLPSSWFKKLSKLFKNIFCI